MLVQALAEGHTLPGDGKAAALAAARVRMRGRWECSPAPAAPEPLAAGAAHWRRPQSAMLFEPTGRGGLGISPSTTLLQAGVVAVGHLSRFAGAGGGAWQWRYREARKRHPLLPNSKEGNREWERVLEELQERAVTVPAPVGTATRYAKVCGQQSVMEALARPPTAGPARAAGAEVVADLVSAARLTAKLKVEHKRKGT